MRTRAFYSSSFREYVFFLFLIHLSQSISARKYALMLCYRVSRCEIGKIDLSIIYFACPSSMSNLHEARIGPPRKLRGSGTKRPGSRPTRVPHTTAPSSSGPARKYTAKSEPAAWSWAQMTSGSGAPKRVLSGGNNHIQT